MQKLKFLFLTFFILHLTFFIPLSQSERGEGYLLHVVPPISSLKILPTDTLVPGKSSNEINIIACPGEYEPASFVISAFSDITSLKLDTTDLKGRESFILSSVVDIKVVKCWYQAGTAWVDIHQDKSKKVLVPELLLNDDNLVKLDYQNKENYLKLSFPKGEKYIWISNPEEKSQEHSKILSIEDFPVKDSPTLLPVNIPAKTNKQFWITVKVPEDAKPGIYSGKIHISTSKEIGSITLKLKVLPFKLSPPYYTSSIYYRGKLDPAGKGSISSELKSEKQFRKELENMFAHGVTNPTVYQGFDKKFLRKTLKIRNEIGMGNQSLYCVGVSAGSPSTPETLREKVKELKEVIEFCKSYGIPEVYFYGIDEARGEGLISQRDAWKAVHEVRGKVFVAGYKDSNFEAMGDIQDLLICYGYPSKEEAEKWHSLGHQIWCYANPQGGIENPEVYRRNFGLLLWKNDYDGAATYAYQHSFGNIWNDFENSAYRDHNFTYPTVDGVIDTIAWEGYREGVDDVRYLTTLLETIKEAKDSGNKRIKGVVAEVEKYLDTLDVEKRNLDNIRLEIINYILKLEDF